jgi:hypothetical protein
MGPMFETGGNHGLWFESCPGLLLLGVLNHGRTFGSEPNIFLLGFVRNMLRLFVTMSVVEDLLPKIA